VYVSIFLYECMCVYVRMCACKYIYVTVNMYVCMYYVCS